MNGIPIPTAASNYFNFKEYKIHKYNDKDI